MKIKVRINTYTCANKHVLVTRDQGDGVTPMFKTCPTCYQQATSAGYRVDQTLTPTHEWYKPAHPGRYQDEQLRKYVLDGGLMFRRIGEGDETEALPAPPKGKEHPGNISALASRALINMYR